jgi:hypothetical protein
MLYFRVDIPSKYRLLCGLMENGTAAYRRISFVTLYQYPKKIPERVYEYTYSKKIFFKQSSG